MSVSRDEARGGPGAMAFAAACVAFALFHVYTSFAGSFDPLVQRGVFIGGALGLAYWIESRRASSAAWRWIAAALAVAGAYGGLHVVLHNARFMDIMNDLEPRDFAAAAVVIVALLVATQRLLGWALPVLTAIALVYYVFGHAAMSGLWQPPRVSFDTVASTLYASTNGIFGFMADIGTGVIAIYVIFGALLMATGAGEVFVQLAGRVAGRGRGGPAKIAVVTSALFGTVSGSAVANVMAVGSVTIPTMERAGYPKAFAAGVEASASAGGQIMPPIMGAGAFLMAELLNIPYLTIAAAAAIPAVMYFTTIFVSVDLYARLYDLGRDDGERPRIDPVKAVPLAIAVGTLVGMLVAGYTPTYSGAAATMALLASALLSRLAASLLGRGDAPGATLRAFGRVLWTGFADGGKGLVMIAVLLGCAGILTSILSASGLGSKVSSELIAIAGDSLLVALVLSAVLCILLGMDVPTTASYVLTASVAAPLLAKLGLPPLTAHLFIFYFAILSAITPPVCASVYAAAAIARERFWSVARYAMLIAGAVYVIPFMLVYRPGLVLQGDATAIAYDAAMTLLAVVAMCSATIGYLAGRAGPLVRLALLATGALFFVPGPVYDATAALMLAAIVAWQIAARRRAAPAGGVAAGGKR